MSEPLRVLILEDNPADAELVQFELQEAGIVFISKVVLTEEDFIRELREFSPDLILSDYDLPKYTGALALAEAKRRCPDIPFILVTGAVTEDRAIDILTQGAKDYVLKNRLEQRLIPAVKRALAEAEEHRARKQAEAELREAHRTLEERVKIRTAELQEQIDTRIRMEEALRGNEERQRLVLQASSIGTFEVDLLTGEGQWNATEFELLGLKPGDVKAAPDTFFRFVHPDDIERLRNEWEEATRSGKLDAEFRIVRADGRECWLAGKGAFIFDGHSDAHDTETGRKPLRFMGVNFDITGRKQAEEKVAAAQKQVQSIIDNTTAIIYALDLEERFLLANTTLAELLNSTPEKMIGKRRHEFMPKDDADWHEANDRQVIKSGRALELEEYSQLRGRSITWLTTKFPLRDAQGRIYAVAGISADISERKQAEQMCRESEEALLQSQNQFNLLIKNIRSGVALIDDAGSFTVVNPSFLRLFGLKEDETINNVNDKNWNDWQVFESDGTLLHVDEHPVRKAAITGKPVKNKLVCVRLPSGGDLIWMLVSADPLFRPDGSIQSTICTYYDITEIKRTEEILKESERKYRSIFENSMDAIFLAIPNQQILAVNPAACAIFGMTEEELCRVGRSGIEDQTDPRHAAAVEERTRTGRVKYEATHVRRDGSRFPSEVSSVIMEGGLRSLVILRDITDRKQVEEALHRSEARWSTALENLYIGAIIATEAEQVIYWNPVARAMHGFKSENEGIEPLEDTSNTFELWTGDGAHQLRLEEWPMRRIKRGENVRNLELQLRRPDQGWEKFVLYSGEMVETAGGEKLIFLSVHDITEQKRAEKALNERTQQLEDANKELESFSYSVSHDLKAPLRAIEGYSRMLLKKDADKLSPDTLRKLDLIHSNTEKMNILIDDLLSFSKVLKSSMVISEINMDKLVKEAWAEIQEANTDREFELKIENIAPGKGDPILIRQVLANLLSNAVKFTKTRKPSIIEMSCYSENGDVVYFIKDNGVGFDMAYYDKLFGVFQRLHSQEEYEGTGVGLAIVQRIISRHGGRIWAEGQVEKGATFYFTLPARQD